MITIFVPAKIHLLGEHAVVYGKPALLAAINKRISVQIVPSKIKSIQGAGIHLKEIRELLKILEKEIMRKTGIKRIEHYSIKIISQVPVGFGLGSSAALSAGIAAALLSFLKIPWNKKLIFDIAYAGEKFFHGNPSGGDLAAVIEGGFLWFRREFEFLKTFSLLPFKPHRNIKQFILINSGKPEESTKEMVEKVAKLRISFPEKVQSLFNSQEELTKQMVIALRDGDEGSLIKCIRSGEKNLEERTQSIVREVEKLGGAAKISGGGGVKKGAGMLLAYHKNFNSLRPLLLHLRLQYYKITLGEQGLRQE